MSRPEVLTTSIDSTTDCPTDSASDTHSHRLQQMKADSGYKSLETTTSTSIAPVSRAPSFTKAQFRCPHDTLEILDIKSERDRSREHTAQETDEVDEGQEDRSGTFVPIRGRAKKGSSFIERRHSGRIAAKKRREILRERQYASLDTGLSLESEIGSDEISGKRSVLARFLKTNRSAGSRLLQRDYSIDEKSDRLFKEFTESESFVEVCGSGGGSGGSGSSTSSRRGRINSRRLHRHLEPSDGSPRSHRRKLSPQDSIEEEDQASADLWDSSLFHESGGSFLKEIPTTATLPEEPE